MNDLRQQIAIYRAEDGSIRLDVTIEHDTVWLRQEQMGELFGRERSVITKHIRNIFSEGGLDEKSNVQNLHIAGSDKPVRFYNLDVIISVGYRVKSAQGTRFRQWANNVLRQHLVHCYSPGFSAGTHISTTTRGKTHCRQRAGGVYPVDRRKQAG